MLQQIIQREIFLVNWVLQLICQKSRGQKWTDYAELIVYIHNAKCHILSKFIIKVNVDLPSRESRCSDLMLVGSYFSISS